MKKYIIPEMTIVQIKRGVHLLSGSEPGLTGTYTGGTILGREADFDFDDEEE